jgi:hypothetical protein
MARTHLGHDIERSTVHDPVQASYEDLAGLVAQNYLRRHYRRLVEEVHEAVAKEVDLEILVDRLPPI